MTKKELEIKACFARTVFFELAKAGFDSDEIASKTVEITNEIFDGICTEPVEPDKENILDKKIKDCEISLRTKNCLVAADIETVGELVDYKKIDLLRLRNFGKKSLQEIEYFLHDNKLEFK